MRKPTICIRKNKDADQLCSKCTADQRLCFRYTDSIIHLLRKSEFPASVAAQPGLCQSWLEPQIVGFLMHRLTVADQFILRIILTSFLLYRHQYITCTLQPHYNAPHYNAVFNITRPFHGSQIDNFTISLYKVTSLLHSSLITRSVSMDPKGSVIMRLTCIHVFNISLVFCISYSF